MLFGLYRPITRLGLLLDELLAVTATSGAPPPRSSLRFFPFSLFLPSSLPPPSPLFERRVFIRGSLRGEKIPRLSCPIIVHSILQIVDILFRAS